MNNFDRIPSELKALKQWILWKREQLENGKSTKIPYSTFHNLASVTNPNDWSTFDSVVATYNLGGFDGIGFVFTENDPYTGIDLDDAEGDAVIYERQLKIFKEFSSYSELSPSGKGLHIIVKGKVESGRRKSKIEIYSAKRYFTMTGNVYQNDTIVEANGLLHQLWEQMNESKVSHSVPSGEETLTDDQILELAFKYNSEKFVPLSEANMSGYPSQSEADQAYMNIVGHYTRSKEQTIRIYSKSKLAQTDSKRRNIKYLTRTVNKAFDQKLALVEFKGYTDGSVAQQVEPTPHKSKDTGSNPVTSTISFPSGLVGEIAEFIYSSAPRPVAEVALAGAISLMAGICGRAYNISGTGINQYVLVLAKTGVGKEAAAEGIDKIMATIRLQVPTSSSFIGPSEISSGPALFKYLANSSQSFLSILGEFGLRLKQLSSPNANGAEVSLRRLILDVYHKSGYSRSLPASAYSKKEDSTSSVASPAFSILGESTPERFYENLNEDMISEGLLPRFLLIEYKGDRPDLNKNHTSIIPNFSLIEKMSTIASHCETINHHNPRRVIDVQYSENALKIADKFNDYCDNNVRGAKEVVRQLWNRAHLKVLKLSALLAVGDNPFMPVINVSNINWAIDLVNMDINNLTHKFEEGMVGLNTAELKQIEELTRILREYLTKDWAYVSKYKAIQSLHTSKIVCNTYLSLRLTKIAAFKNDKLGGTTALKRAIQTMIDNGYLKLAGGPEFQEKHKLTGKAYYINDNVLSE